MSEAIISRRGSKQGDPSTSYVYRMQMYTSSNMFTAPNATNNTFHITMIGGGGGGQSNNYGSGGGSGWMNFGDIELNYGQIVPITVGAGGSAGQSGGSSSFGTYLSANGGETGTNNHGGNGGAGGGGGESGAGGGIGFQFGGGGSGAVHISDYNDMMQDGYQGRHGKSFAKGGDGGPWGGGGGSGGFGRTASSPIDIYFGWDPDYEHYANETMPFPSNYGSYTTETVKANFFKRYGNGGTYGGNGGGPLFICTTNNVIWDNSKPQNGTNTFSWSNVNANYRGYGRAGSRFGYVTEENSRENSRRDWDDYNVVWYSGAGGGGGYGGNGGSSQESIEWSNSGAGGGGGYGANGGNGSWGWWARVGVGDIRGGDGYGGGGGGYGCDGKDATNNTIGNTLGYKGAGGGGGFGNIPGISTNFGGGGNATQSGDGGVILIEYYGE